MSPRAFQRRDFDELERRRMRGARLLHRGISQAEVARQVKVSRESVRRWANRMAQEGAAAALRKAGCAGRKPRLSEKQLQQLEARLREGAEKAGFPNGLWTLERVAGVIREQFGGEYHSGGSGANFKLAQLTSRVCRFGITRPPQRSRLRARSSAGPATCR